jgi:hypothetical protein
VKDTDISTPAQLEAGLALGGTLKRTRLWRIAEGRIGWLEAVGVLAAFLLVCFGLIQYGRAVGVTDFMRNGVVFVVAGLMLLISFQWGSAQRQRSALLELIKRLEQHRP